MNVKKALTDFIEKELVYQSWGEYGGLRTPTLAQLGSLKVLVDAAIAVDIAEKTMESNT